MTFVLVCNPIRLAMSFKWHCPARHTLPYLNNALRAGTPHVGVPARIIFLGHSRMLDIAHFRLRVLPLLYGESGAGIRSAGVVNRLAANLIVDGKKHKQRDICQAVFVALVG